MTSLVIFDCDGVLVDSEPISCRITAEVLGSYGVPIDTAGVMRRFLGHSQAAIRRLAAEEFGVDIPERYLSEVRQRIVPAFRAELRAIPGIHQVLEALTVPICVGSGSQPERIRLSLELTGLDGFFGKHIFSASQVARSKPAPDLFLFAAEKMGHPPADTLVVEDAVAGVTAAVAAGMTVVGFTGGSHSDGAPMADRLRAAGAIDVMPDMPALGRWIAAD